MPAMILCGRTANAGQFWARVIRGVGVQALFECPRRQSQGLPPRCHLDCFEIEIADGLTA
jgi:hypothetical protein